MKDRWIQRDLLHNWHPYTQMKDCEFFPPVLIEKARGIKLHDASGGWYYDTISSWWCNIHGHNHPGIMAALRRQSRELDHVLFAGFTHKPAVILSEKLVKILPPGLTRIFYSDNGSTAVEVAMKMSFQYWRNKGVKTRNLFVSLDHAYHGDTIGTMSVSGTGGFHSAFSPLFFRSLKAVSPYCYRCPLDRKKESCGIECLKSLETIFKKHAGKISAFIIEPMLMAAGGMIVYPPEYLRGAFELSRRYNIHFIADEVATGFGRTGRMFACEHADIRPDFVCLSKGITGGVLPLAATAVTEEIYSAFYDDFRQGKTFFHGHTYTANPLAISAAVASISLFEGRQLLIAAEEKSRLIKRELGRFRNFDIVGDVRGIGLVWAVELVSDKKTKQPFPPEKRAGFRIYTESLKHNLILRPLGDVIYLFLPFSVTKKEIKDIIGRMEKIIRWMEKHKHENFQSGFSKQ